MDRVDVTLGEGADARTVGAALRTAVADGGRVFTKAAYVAASSPETDGRTRVGLLLVLGIALLYSGIALANTMVMATADRVRDLAVLRLAGATKAQVLWLVAAEAVTVVAVGAVGGVLVAGLNLLGMWGALGVLRVPSVPVMPWSALVTVAAACAATAVVAAVVPAWLSLRRRPVQLAEVHE